MKKTLRGILGKKIQGASSTFKPPVLDQFQTAGDTLSFAPAEAFQFDWSHEHVELAGMPAIVKAAHIRLCHSRKSEKPEFPDGH